jgi:hypothetical protein
LIYRVTARKQLDIVIITFAVPADRKSNGLDVCCGRLLNGHRDTGRRTYFRAGDLHRATSGNQQERGQCRDETGHFQRVSGLL